MEPTPSKPTPGSDDDGPARLTALLRSFRAGMLVTQCSASSSSGPPAPSSAPSSASKDEAPLRSRPMAVAGVDDDGTVWFVTSTDSPKVAEVGRRHQVNVAFQDGESKFVSLSGTAETVDDRRKLDELWSDAWKVYFPQGRDTPSLTLLKVTAESGEYWDNSSVAQKLRFMVEAGKAFLTGRSADPASLGANQKVKLSH